MPLKSIIVLLMNFPNFLESNFVKHRKQNKVAIDEILNVIWHQYQKNNLISLSNNNIYFVSKQTAVFS